MKQHSHLLSPIYPNHTHLESAGLNGPMKPRGMRRSLKRNAYSKTQLTTSSKDHKISCHTSGTKDALGDSSVPQSHSTHGPRRHLRP